MDDWFLADLTLIWHSNPVYTNIQWYHYVAESRYNGGEVVTIAPGRSTRPHTHHDTDETYYILYGEGNFLWDDEEIACKAGSNISYPIGVKRAVFNTGQFPMSYLVISASMN